MVKCVLVVLMKYFSDTYLKKCSQGKRETDKEHGTNTMAEYSDQYKYELVLSFQPNIYIFLDGCAKLGEVFFK